MKGIFFKALFILTIISQIFLILTVLTIFTGCSHTETGKGYTGLIEGRTYSIASPVSDRLINLTVSEGNLVTAGQDLGEIDTEVLTLQRKGLIAKQDQLELQKKELGLNMAQVRDTRDHYRSTYDKNLELFKIQAVSDQTIRDLKLNADKWSRDLESLSLKGETLERQKDEIGYKIRELDLLIAKASLTSPDEGYIDKIFYEPGEFVPALRPVLQLISLRKVWCYIYVGETVLAEMPPGKDVEVFFGENTFPARVEHINSRAEFTPKEVLTPDNRAALVYAVRIGIENPEGILKIGMPVDISW